MKTFYWVLLLGVIYVALACIGIYLDLLFNPWLYSVSEHWHWYNYLTTQHAMTIAVIRHNYLLLAVPPIVISFFMWIQTKIW